MKSHGDSTRGVAIVVAAVVALSFVIVNARTHFEAIARGESSSARALAVGRPAVGSSQTARIVLPTAPEPLHARALSRLDAIPLSPARAIGSVDSVVEESAERLHVIGWIVLPNRTLADHVVAIVDGRKRYDITDRYGSNRPDVANALGTQAVINSGVDATIELHDFGKGSHQLTLGSIGGHGRDIATLATGRTFIWK